MSKTIFALIARITFGSNNMMPRYTNLVEYLTIFLKSFTSLPLQTMETSVGWHLHLILSFYGELWETPFGICFYLCCCYRKKKLKMKNTLYNNLTLMKQAWLSKCSSSIWFMTVIWRCFIEIIFSIQLVLLKIYNVSMLYIYDNFTDRQQLAHTGATSELSIPI